MIGRSTWALIVVALLLAAVVGGIWTLNSSGPGPAPGDESGESPQTAPRLLAPVGLEIGSDRGAGPYRLAIGDQIKLLAAVELEDGSTRYDAPIAWSSSDPQIASIGPDGSLGALANGDVRVKAELVPLAAEVSVSVAG